MKRSFIIGAIALMMGACSTLPEGFEDIKGVAGVDVGNGSNAYDKTTYRGAKLPPQEHGGSEMIELLTLIGKQSGEIDDELFESLLTEKLFSCKNRFMLDDDNTWTWAFDWVGGPVLGTIMPTEEGIYYETSMPGCAFVGDFGHDYMHKEGYEGWYNTYEWSYDADTHTLKTTTGHDFKLEAEVLYFDGTRAVLVGHVGGVAWYGWRGNDATVRLSFKEELYLFEFIDGRDKFLDGYIAEEEYNTIMNEYLNRYSEYEGAKMPEKGNGYEEMMYMLNTIEQSRGISNEYMNKRLNEWLISCNRIYTQRENEQGEKQWQIASGEYHNAVMCNTDGSGHVSTSTRGSDGAMEQWMADEGYYGWYEDITWSYDANSHILTTSNGVVTCQAEVVFFDSSTHVILKGHVAGISETTTNELGEVVPVSDVEFFDAMFCVNIILSYDEATGDVGEVSRDNFLDGYYSYDDYWTKADLFAM